MTYIDYDKIAVVLASVLGTLWLGWNVHPWAGWWVTLGVVALAGFFAWSMAEAKAGRVPPPEEDATILTLAGAAAFLVVAWPILALAAWFITEYGWDGMQR